MIDLSCLSNCVVLTRFKMATVFFILWILQEKRSDKLYRLEGCLIPEPNPSGLLTLPSDCLK